MRLHHHNTACCAPSPAVFAAPFFNDFYRGIANPHSNEFSPRIDISEDKTNLYIHVEVSGMSKEDVKISVNDERLLTIKGEKLPEKKSDDHSQIRTERRYGSFERTFRLPESIKFENIAAAYKNGVLELTVPKKESEQPKEYNVSIN
ncbi:MAG: Hsp20/alpha crystallin family protein [Candidatus Kapabacteria bacterium]|nr:Hsp20/alpha crystallin family protein [Candidatus Kapabacteria bacterium]